MNKNFLLPLILLTGMLFSGFSSFSQNITSLNPEKKKDAAYIQAHQQQINQGVKPEARAMNNGTSALSASPKKDPSGIINAETVKSPDYYNARSIIFSDPRTPRYPLTGNKEQDIANYKKAKAVWMANNPQPKITPVMSKEQARDRAANNK